MLPRWRRMRNVATVIIGGGITGAATLHWLASAGDDVVLLEASSAIGGVIASRRNDIGALIESGPNSTLLSEPLLRTLIDQLDLNDELAFANPAAAKRFIVRSGRMVAVPTSVRAIISSDLFSASAKLRVLREPFIPRGAGSVDETIAAFVIRRFGREALDYAANPFVSGVYAGRPEDLSLRHAFPRVFDLEQKYGSVLRGAIARMRDARRERASANRIVDAPQPVPQLATGLVSFREGMATLPRRIEQKWKANVRTGS
ncbi:MAG: protoporphyrinogen oxidase, partial [bacterium]|nr:protoporphyrinogen oxidase [Candidatus Kapabacteria bacterium]